MPKLQNTLGTAALVAWFAVGSAASALLMARHVVAMPDPVDLDRLDRSTRDHPITHIIPATCSCTDRLLSSLLERTAEDDALEHIVLVGRSARWEARLRESDARFTLLRAHQLEPRHGVVAGPLLVVHDGDALRYAGGYYREPAAIHPQTDALIDAARTGVTAPLPVFGCPVTESVRTQLEPWRRWFGWLAVGG